MLVGPGAIAWAVSVSVLGAAISAVGSSGASAAAPAPPADVPLIYHKGRNFRIPFNLNADARSRVKELRLLVSQDLGYTWRPWSRTVPDHPAFSFRSSHDGEHWFAVQTLTVDGKVSPALDSTVEPSLKVIVDTLPPSLLLEPDDRRGSTASVRWEVKDENLDVKSLTLEYQVEGVGVWRRVPIRRPKLIGAQRWDAGTAEALKVRMSVADRAGNVTTAVIDLPEGTANQPESVTDAPGYPRPPAVEQIAAGPQPRIIAGADFTPANEDLVPSRPTSTDQDNRAPFRTGDARAGRPRAPAPEWDRDAGPRPRTPSRFARSSLSEISSPATGANPQGGFGGPVAPALASAGSGPMQSVSQPTGSASGPGPLLVDSPRFKLNYAVDDAGPSGPASVELWLTNDGGRTWVRRGEDPDRASPIDVDVGGEGSFGICLVARSATGLGDQPPAPGDQPQSWVEVDATPPAVLLDRPQVGTGASSGKLAITWRATDLHLVPRSVSLFWRPDQPGALWQPFANAQENAGQFVWTVPASIPPRFHIRAEAVDTLGHHGGADTTDTGPITVDRSRPRSRIIGLDASASGGSGSTTWPLR
jgi:hypothetical protein